MDELKNPDTFARFTAWLRDSGVDVQSPKIWEIVRFKVDSDVGIIYHNKYGNITSATPYALDAWDNFSHNKPWHPISGVRKQNTLDKRRLIRKYGKQCFYCGDNFAEKDLTLEHLMPLSHGGRNNHHNYVLACEPHNKEAGSLPLIEKIELRDRIRQTKEARRIRELIKK